MLRKALVVQPQAKMEYQGRNKTNNVQLGGFCVQLSHLYPSLSFVLQDRAPVLKIAETEVWPRESPEALRDGRITFMEHDFFMENPVKGAEVYWLRSILYVLPRIFPLLSASYF